MRHQMRLCLSLSSCISLTVSRIYMRLTIVLVVLLLYGDTLNIALASPLTSDVRINLQSEGSNDSLQKSMRNGDDATVNEETSSSSGDYSTVDEIDSLNASEWYSMPTSNVFNKNSKNVTQSNAAEITLPPSTGQPQPTTPRPEDCEHHHCPFLQFCKMKTEACLGKKCGAKPICVTLIDVVFPS